MSETAEFIEGYTAHHVHGRSIYTCPYGIFSETTEAEQWLAGWKESEQYEKDYGQDYGKHW